MENNQVLGLKTEINTNIIKAFKGDNFENDTQRIPYVMRPKGSQATFRCCVEKERAVLKDRVIAALGFSIEDDDQLTLLSEYAKIATERKEPDKETLTVLQVACKGCASSGVFVTTLCQGCVARRCVGSCKFDAIKIVDGKAKVDESKCRNCGLCIDSCPYEAIKRILVPCENVCPVGAIKKDDNGNARIDFNTCISCGKCVVACPFGAVHEKSQIIDILSRIKEGKKLFGLLAPAIVGQSKTPIGKIKTAMIQSGFFDVLEVAQGADCTTRHEAQDFAERMEKGDAFMTTSCCAAYNELVKKHIPDMKPFVSHTHTPMHYTAEIAKEMCSDCVTVFVSPCATKRKEGIDDPNVDYVLNFQELFDLFDALNIDIDECEEATFEVESSKQGRNFPVTSGVASAVSDALKTMKSPHEVKPLVIAGLTKVTIKELVKYAKDGVCPDHNLIEIMSCNSGCVGGSSVVINSRNAAKNLKPYVDSGKDIEV